VSLGMVSGGCAPTMVTKEISSLGVEVVLGDSYIKGEGTPKGKGGTSHC